MKKFLLILMVLLTVATVSCKKAPDPVSFDIEDVQATNDNEHFTITATYQYPYTISEVKIVLCLDKNWAWDAQQDGDKISVTMSMATANYYANVSNPKGFNCPLYICFDNGGQYYYTNAVYFKYTLK